MKHLLLISLLSLSYTLKAQDSATREKITYHLERAKENAITSVILTSLGSAATYYGIAYSDKSTTVVGVGLAFAGAVTGVIAYNHYITATTTAYITPRSVGIKIRF